MTQAHIYYSGTVQGVGFRYTTQQLASNLGLKGWVRNCRDGQVEIVAEGEEETIQELIQQLKSHFAGHIQNQEVNFQPSAGQFNSFQITH